jgi:hypothetical protein
MNARLNICQAAHDAKLPPMVSETPQEIARAEWLYNAAERMIRAGLGVTVQLRGERARSVTMQDLALALDDHVNNRLADCMVSGASLGWLMLSINWSSHDKNAEEELLGHSDHVFGMRGEIAERLLAPLADDALKAQAEDDAA